MDHSFLSPSNAEQWVNCPGSVQLNVLTPPKPSDPSASEGTVVHDIAAEMINGITKARLPGRTSSALWDTVRDGVLINKEMIDAALMYAKYIEPIIQSTRVFGGPNISIENRIEIPDIHSTCFGHCDFWLYDAELDTLHVIEFKYGHGVIEAFENWQLLTYTNGIFTHLGLVPSQVFLTVVQPRAPHRDGPIRTWTINFPPDLDVYFERLKTSAADVMSADPKTVTGSHCRYCPSILTCDSSRNASFNAVDIVGSLGACATSEDSLWYELYILERAKKAVEHRVTALRTEVESKIRSGVRVPRYKMTDKYSHPFWSIPHEQVLQLGQSHGIDLSVPKTLTPMQAKKEGVPEELIQAFSRTEKRGVKLEFDDLKEARFVFGSGGRDK